MRNQEWYATLAQLYSLNFAKLVLSFLFRDAVDGEATFGIVDEAEIFPGLLDGDHVHEAGRIGWVSANFAVDFDEALHDDCFGFAAIEGVLETVVSKDQHRRSRFVRCFAAVIIPIPNEDDQRHTIPQFVWTWAGFRRIGTAQLVEQPV